MSKKILLFEAESRELSQKTSRFARRISTLILIWIGKAIFFISKIFNLGAGGTWPGEIALKLDPCILAKIAPKNIILVAGTNGKTTTAKMIGEILGDVGGLRVITNESGANLLNGMVSALINASDCRGKIRADWAILETDENTLPQVLRMLKLVQHDDLQKKKLIIILLNLFRDQLDRYGEVNLIAKRWIEGFEGLEEFGGEITTIIDADDSQLAWIGKNLKGKIKYFGLEDENLFLAKMQHATDSTYCPNCGAKLNYRGVYFSHLGRWRCGECGLKRPKLDLLNWSNWANLAGVYNRYNVLAAVLAAKAAGATETQIEENLKTFKPAFGRQEEIIIGNKKIRILLSKNPAGFNESIRALKEFPRENKNILLILNDRIPDGRDVSWIWDVDFEMISQIGQVSQIGVSGDRAYDMGLRLKYAGIRDLPAGRQGFGVFGGIGEAIKTMLEETKKEETLYILATYSGMLEARKILTGKKLL